MKTWLCMNVLSNVILGCYTTEKATIRLGTRKTMVP